MPRLPTVKLVHKTKLNKRTKRPLTRIVNQWDYARNMAAWQQKGWRLLSARRGEASAEVEAVVQRQAAIERHRNTDPEEVRKRGDKARAAEQAKLVVHDTGSDKDEPKAPEALAEPEAPAVDISGWRDLPWFKRKKVVGEATGTVPKNMADAEELMKPLEAK